MAALLGRRLKVLLVSCARSAIRLSPQKDISELRNTLLIGTDGEGLALAALNESSIQSFEHHLCRCRCPQYGGTHAENRPKGSARLFLRYLCDAGVATDSVGQTAFLEPVLLTAFLDWMRQQRGTSDRTLNNYIPSVRDLLKNAGDDPQRLTAEKVRKFVLERTRQSGWGAAKFCATGLRMFLRFLIADGQCPAGLDACIPTRAHWRLSSLPQYLQPGDVERIIASCDRATPVGCRDYAILLLLARMGFRAGDIDCLRLADINWEQAWIDVSGKGRRQTRLPLTQEIGDAIAAYLLQGRPPCVSDRLFVGARPPFREFRSACAMTMIVRRAMRRAKVTCPSRGAAHVLRHSAATSMLRQGASLQEIAVILRHRSIQTTEVYAKVDVAALNLIAQPWPEVNHAR